MKNQTATLTNYYYSPARVTHFPSVEEAEKAVMAGRDILHMSEWSEFAPNTRHYFSDSEWADMPQHAIAKIEIHDAE